MNDNVTEKDMELWFREYLNETFGEEFNRFVTPPAGAKFGERLIYKYKSGKVANRQEPTQQEVDEINAGGFKIAADNGGEYVPGPPPVTSGLPFPRLVDLRHDFVVWENAMNKYHESEDLLPRPDFDLEWALGLLFASDKTLYHLDFTHPKVKAIFSFEYDEDYGMPKYDIARKRFMEFIILLETYKKLSNDFDPFSRLKLTQVDSKITITIN